MTAWNIGWFLAAWFWIAVFIGLISGEWFRRHGEHDA